MTHRAQRRRYGGPDGGQRNNFSLPRDQCAAKDNSQAREVRHLQRTMPSTMLDNSELRPTPR